MSWHAVSQGSRNDALKEFQALMSEQVEHGLVTQDLSNSICAVAAGVCEHISELTRVNIQSYGHIGSQDSNGLVSVAQI